MLFSVKHDYPALSSERTGWTKRKLKAMHMKYSNPGSSTRKLMFFVKFASWVFLLMMTMMMSSSFVTAQVTNPRKSAPLSGGIGDPYIFKFKGKYFLYSSTE